MSVKSFDEYFFKIESEIKIKNSDHASIYLTEKKLYCITIKYVYVQIIIINYLIIQ